MSPTAVLACASFTIVFAYILTYIRVISTATQINNNVVFFLLFTVQNACLSCCTHVIRASERYIPIILTSITITTIIIIIIIIIIISNR